VVIRFDDDGSMYKVKTDWYFERSKKEKQEFTLNSERSIWRIILDQQMDDALVFMNDSHLSKRVKEFEIKLYEVISEVSSKYERIADKYRYLPKRGYVEAINKDDEVPKEAKGLLFKLYDKTSKNVINVVIGEVKKGCNSSTGLEKARKLLGSEIRFRE